MVVCVDAWRTILIWVVAQRCLSVGFSNWCASSFTRIVIDLSDEPGVVFGVRRHSMRVAIAIRSGLMTSVQT